MQKNMDGIFKKIVFVSLLLTLISGCKKDEKIDTVKSDLVTEGRALIKQNSNVLIDSLERYDLAILNKKKGGALKVALLDSLLINERYSKYSSEPFNFFTFKLDKNNISNFKSPYKLYLVQKEISQNNVLFVSFSNLKIDNDIAQIMVIKISGNSSVIDRYYFKKQNNKWIFTSKEKLSMG